MSGPLTAAKFLAALKGEGLNVVEVGNWQTHSRSHKGPWGPVHGVMIHHTVTRGTATTVAICRNGYASLPGPLCHGVIAKSGDVHTVGYGRTNHAGLGDAKVLAAVISEKYGTEPPAKTVADVDGNRHFYGFECENLGDGSDPWPPAQVEAIARAAAAVCRAHGWTEKSVISHQEWQVGKTDPRGIKGGMPAVRARVAVLLKSPAGKAKPVPAPAPPKPVPLTLEQRVAALEKRVGALEKG